MITTDYADFAKTMISCFQNYRANISEEMVREWFDSKLKSFPFFSIKKAFNDYVDNYKNKFPPTRGAIIQLSIGLTLEDNIKKELMQTCSNMIGDKVCCNKVYLYNICEYCYENKRPKSDVEVQLQEWLKKDHEEAIREGCKTSADFRARARRKLGMLPMGKIVIEEIERNRTSRTTQEKVNDCESYLKNFTVSPCAKHNNPENFQKSSEMI